MKLYYHAIEPGNMNASQGQKWFFRRDDLVGYLAKLFTEAVDTHSNFTMTAGENGESLL